MLVTPCGLMKLVSEPAISGEMKLLMEFKLVTDCTIASGGIFNLVIQQMNNIIHYTFTACILYCIISQSQCCKALIFIMTARSSNSTYCQDEVAQLILIH